MIHAFALEPQVVASWGRRDEFRFFYDKFGLGAARVMLELPAFNKWKKKVYDAAMEIGLSEQDLKRVEELFRLFSEHRHRRKDANYDGVLSWLENAEREYARRKFAGILAKHNPRQHEAVLIAAEIGSGDPRWDFEVGVSLPRTPEGIARSLSAMVTNCRQLHLVDPYFGPENARHRRVIESLLCNPGDCVLALDVVRVHCSRRSELAFFEQQANRMAQRIPLGVRVEFVRWRQRPGGQRFHNRYVLSDVGGVMFGDGLDDDDGDGAGQTDDVQLLSSDQYRLRWNQYAEEDGAFECVDRPTTVVGSWVGTRPRRNE